MLLGSALTLGGCCLSVVSGGTGNFETGSGSGGTTTSSAGTTGAASTTGAPAGTSSGGVVQCGPPANPSNIASYPSPALENLLSADLNGDGLLDLVVTGGTYQSEEVLVFLALPDGGLGAPTHYAGTDSFAVAVGDLNADGAPDVVASDQSEIQIFLNDGTGHLNSTSPINLAGVASIQNIAIADFNADGLGDLLLDMDVYDGGPTTALLLAQTPLKFAAPVAIAGINGLSVSGFFLVDDLNQDGLPDIVENSSDKSDLAVLLNLGDGGFETSLYPTPAYFQLVSVPHVGRPPDLAFGLRSSPGMGIVGLQILKNSGRGAFSIGPVYSLGDPNSLQGFWLTVGDFNGDCSPDIVAAGPGACAPGTSSLSVLYGDQEGGFTAPVSLPVPENDAWGVAAQGTVENPRGFAVGDNCVNDGVYVYVYGDPTR